MHPATGPLLLFLGEITLVALLSVYFWQRRVVAWNALAVAWRRWVRRHPRVPVPHEEFTAAEYLGAHLTVAAICTLAGLSIFTLVGAQVGLGTRGLVDGFDHRIAMSVHTAATPRGIALLKELTTLGSFRFYLLVVPAVALALRVRRRTLLVTAWLVATIGAQVIDLLLKEVFRRARPEFTNPYVHEPSYSFPSGHSMGSIVVYGMLAYLAVLGVRSIAGRWVLGVLAALLVLTIGFSRVYLGAHYVSDVVGGFAAGAAWLAACVSGTEVARRSAEHAARGENPRPT